MSFSEIIAKVYRLIFEVVAFIVIIFGSIGVFWQVASNGSGVTVAALALAVFLVAMVLVFGMLAIQLDNNYNLRQVLFELRNRELSDYATHDKKAVKHTRKEPQRPSTPTGQSSSAGPTLTGSTNASIIHTRNGIKLYKRDDKYIARGITFETLEQFEQWADKQ